MISVQSVMCYVPHVSIGDLLERGAVGESRGDEFPGGVLRRRRQRDVGDVHARGLRQRRPRLQRYRVVLDLGL